MATYDVKCPRCAKQATATMLADGVAGTYREPLVRLVARRIVCGHCGFNVTSDDAIPCQLWYTVSVRGRWAWAHNRDHAMFLVNYLLDRIPPGEIDRVDVETLPGWMIEPKNRMLVAEKLQRLLDAGEKTRNSKTTGKSGQ